MSNKLQIQERAVGVPPNELPVEVKFEDGQVEVWANGTKIDDVREVHIVMTSHSGSTVMLRRLLTSVGGIEEDVHLRMVNPDVHARVMGYSESQ